MLRSFVRFSRHARFGNESLLRPVVIVAPTLCSVSKRFATHTANPVAENDRMMTADTRRVSAHPVLSVKRGEQVSFKWNGTNMTGYQGEALSSALIANGVDIFGHHHKDNSPQGIFCANGQCSQCMVVVNGLPMKSCMTPTVAGLDVKQLDGRPILPADDVELSMRPLQKPKEVDVLIVGAGPAGLSAATELGKLGAQVLLVDDKNKVGGKLLLQTHKFFGTQEDCYAGTRGFEIADILHKKVLEHPSVEIMLNTNALAVYSDKVVTLVQVNTSMLVKPKKILVASGAREKFLSFPGNTLPGVYGAGAFQTLVNRDLVRPCKKALIVGGGNVGLIGGYHAIQAGIEVVGLVEALPECGGYQVHMDKLHRLGVPIMTRTTVLEARGKNHLEQVITAALDNNFVPIPGTEKTYNVDCLLIAVGLESCNEFYKKAVLYGLDAFVAGDAREIAEASSAMFTGKIAGRNIARSLGYRCDVPDAWHAKEAVLKSKPGPQDHQRITKPLTARGVQPIIHCYQDVPCNACTTACKLGNIKIAGDGIKGQPLYLPKENECTGCARCVTRCPGLAISVVDYDSDPDYPRVTLPYELWRGLVKEGEKVTVTAEDGSPLGKYEVISVHEDKEVKTAAVTVSIAKAQAHRATGIWHAPFHSDAQAKQQETNDYRHGSLEDDSIVCRCERVSVGELRRLIRSGVRDENELKAATRCGMGACGSKTCHALLQRLYREEGVHVHDVTERTLRPLHVEVPLGTFADIVQ